MTRHFASEVFVTRPFHRTAFLADGVESLESPHLRLHFGLFLVLLSHTVVLLGIGDVEFGASPAGDLLFTSFLILELEIGSGDFLYCAFGFVCWVLARPSIGLKHSILKVAHDGVSRQL